MVTLIQTQKKTKIESEGKKGSKPAKIGQLFALKKIKKGWNDKNWQS